MIVEVLAADAVTMSVCIVSPAVHARVSDISRQKSSKPVDVVCRSPGLFPVSIQPMDGNNAGSSQCQLLTIWMAYSTTGRFPSATSSRPWAGASRACPRFEEPPTCFHRQSNYGTAYGVDDFLTASLRSPRNGINLFHLDGAMYPQRFLESASMEK